MLSFHKKRVRIGGHLTRIFYEMRGIIKNIKGVGL
jgi:hypothetical protein